MTIFYAVILGYLGWRLITLVKEYSSEDSDGLRVARHIFVFLYIGLMFWILFQGIEQVFLNSLKTVAEELTSRV